MRSEAINVLPRLLGEDATADGGVQSQHSSAMADQGVAVEADGLIVVFLGVVGLNGGQFALREEFEGVVP